MPHPRLAAAVTAGLLLAGCTAHGGGVDGSGAPSNASTPPVRHIAPGELLDAPATARDQQPTPASAGDAPRGAAPSSSGERHTAVTTLGPPGAGADVPTAAAAEDLPDDPTAVAMGAVAASLHGEGLDIFELTAQLTDIAAGHVTVRVAAAHTAGGGHPHQSVYDLELGADGDGWHIRRFVEAPLP